MHAAVSTCIDHRPTTIKHVALRAVSVVTDFNAFRNVQISRAVVRRRNRLRTFHGRNIVALHDHVRRAVQNGRGRHILTLHRHRLRQNASALVDRLKNELRVFVTLRVILCACQIHHDVSAQSRHFLPVQFTIPTEPASKALIAVVIVGTEAQLKALGIGHGHVVQKQRALVVSCAGQSAQHLHVEHGNGRRVYVAHLEPTLRRIVGNQQRMVGVFSQPIRGILLVDKARVHVKDLVGIQHTMHRTRQSRAAAVRSILKRQRVGRILHEVIGIGHSHRTQAVKANRPIVRVVLPLFQGSVTLGGRGFTNSNVYGFAA